MKRLLTLALLALASAGALGAAEKPAETKEVTISIPRRFTFAPAGGAPFTLKAPLVLDGKAPTAEALRGSLEKAIKYILDAQNKDGSWTFGRNQVRRDVPAKDMTFHGTAASACNQVVMTCLCCMALRAHEELAPERIRAAVNKGLRYVIENAPQHKQESFGIWSWAFATMYLAAEHRRTTDAALKASIVKAMQATAKEVMAHQNAGRLPARALPPRPARGGEPQPPGQGPKGTIRAGTFGLDLVEKGKPGEEGVLVHHVISGTPAVRGLLKGDRILEVDGVKIDEAGKLRDLLDRIKQGQTVKLKVSRDPAGEKAAVKKPKQTNDGGWDYKAPFTSGTQSFATAIAVLALMDAKSVGVDVKGDAIDRGIDTLLGMRHREEGSWEDAFYYTVADLSGPPPDVRSAVGRTSICTLALLKAGKADQEDLACALESFVLRRGELDRVRGFGGTHFLRSHANAAYYFLFAHYVSASALPSLKDKTLRERCGKAILEALLKIQAPEGTWTDHPAFGQLYGTAMALMALEPAKQVVPDAYKTPLPGLK